MKKALTVLVAGLLLAGSIAFAAQEIYKIDPAHSSVGFKIKHLGVSYVVGAFNKFDGEVVMENDKPISIDGVVEVDSIDTADAKRDAHLKSDDFFAKEQFPQIKFKSTKITVDGNKLGVVGDLTIRDVTKPVVLSGEWGGKVFMAGANVNKVGLSLEGQINRQDFGLKFDKLLETGQAVVGNDVTLTIELEANSPTVAK